jgi:hypothetical protein
MKELKFRGINSRVKTRNFFRIKTYYNESLHQKKGDVRAERA